MSAPLFLVEALPTGDTVTLDGPEGHHAATVQRLRVGEELLLADGRGGTAAAVVTAVGRGTLDARITSRGTPMRASPGWWWCRGSPRASGVSWPCRR